MNLKIEFARKMALAYTAVCRPLCQEMKLPQTAFDILMFLYNNPEYKNGTRYCGNPQHQGEPGFSKCGKAGAGRLY